MNEVQKFNWEVNYLDSNNEIDHTDIYNNLTKEEVWKKAEENCPKNRFIEDFSIIKLDIKGEYD